MKVLVASDGDLPADSAAELAIRLAGGDGTIRVMTAIEVPRSVLESLRSVYQSTAPSPPVASDAEYVATTSPSSPDIPGWPGDDTFIERYVSDQTNQRLTPIAEAIEGRGARADVLGVEAEDPARAVMDQIESFNADVLVVGSHGRGRFEGLLGSVGTKLVRQSPVTVVVCKH